MLLYSFDLNSLKKEEQRKPSYYVNNKHWQQICEYGTRFRRSCLGKERYEFLWDFEEKSSIHKSNFKRYKHKIFLSLRSAAIDVEYK